MKKSILNTLLLAVCWVGAYSQAQAVEKLNLEKQTEVRQVIPPDEIHKRDSSISESHGTSGTSSTPSTITREKAPPKLGTGKTTVAGVDEAIGPFNTAFQSLLSSVSTVVTPLSPVLPANHNALWTNIQHEIQTNENAAQNDEQEHVPNHNMKIPSV